MLKKTIGIIGFGNMGSAIAEQLKNDYQILCFDKDNSKIECLSGIEAASDVRGLLDKSEIIFLAVKPQNFQDLMIEIKSCQHLSDKLFISIAAGILTRYIEKHLGVVRVIRAMPNIALKIQEAVICLCSGKYASEEDFDFAEDLFDYMGETIRIEEDKFNGATAVSGSGPGYFFNLIQAKGIDSNNIVLVKKFSEEFFRPELTKAAKNIGFNSEEAEFLSKTTTNSCLGLLIKTGLPPAELEKKVISKGGTTFAGLEVFRKGGTLIQAVEAAKKRAEELSKKE